MAKCNDKENQDAASKILFDQTDETLKIRTMVIDQGEAEALDNGGLQRSLVLTDASDRSVPCELQWWLDHNPQGMGVCSQPHAGDNNQTMSGCKPCPRPMVDDIWNGYVRTMLAVAIFTPPTSQSFIQVRETRASAQRFLTTDDSQDMGWVPREKPRHLAVIGLGASTMANWIQNHLPNTELDVAEIVPGVAAAAPCFGLDTSSKNLRIHVQDGRKFLEEAADDSFDALLIDAFDPKESLPSCFKSSEFFQLVHRKVAPGGAVAFNLLDFPKDSRRVLAGLRQAFDGGSLWAGQAPGAQGIQEVIVGLRAGPSKSSQSSSSLAENSHSFLEQASFVPLDPQRVDGAEPLADSDVCPNAASKSAEK
jgi:spermidine synthase